jgi:hypothetical protein
MNNWAILFNFRFIDYKNRIVFCDRNKSFFIRINNFRALEALLLNIVKKKNSNVCNIDFDYETLSSPYI